MRVLQRFLGLVFAIYCLLGCGNLRNPYSVQATPSSSHTQPPSFSAQRGAVVSLAQDGTGAWMASVTEPLLPNAPRVVPVRFESGDPMGAVAALAELSASQQRSMLHVFPTAAGPEILYVGKVGLQGGGKWHQERCSYSDCKARYLQCSCGWECDEGRDFGTHGLHFCAPVVGSLIIAGRTMANSFTCKGDWIQYCAQHCTCVCATHKVGACPKCDKCTYCNATCSRCCGCAARAQAQARQRLRQLALKLKHALEQEASLVAAVQGWNHQIRAEKKAEAQRRVKLANQTALRNQRSYRSPQTGNIPLSCAKVQKVAEEMNIMDMVNAAGGLEAVTQAIVKDEEMTEKQIKELNKAT